MGCRCRCTAAGQYFEPLMIQCWQTEPYWSGAGGALTRAAPALPGPRRPVTGAEATAPGPA